MRITNNMISQNYMNNLNNNLWQMDKYQRQLSSNKRITRLSDDPVGVVSLMQARVKLYRLDQYQDNIASAKSWLAQTEAAVSDINEVLKTAYETTVEIANSYDSPADKQATAEVIGQLRDEIFSLGNSTFGGKYIFGGFNTEKPPFTLDAGTGKILYNGVDMSDSTNPDLIDEQSQLIEYEIGFGMKTQLSTTGAEMLGTGADNIYNMLNDLYNALQNDAPEEEISAFVTKLQNCQSNVLAVQAGIGGKTTRLDLIANRYEDDFIRYSEERSNVEDIDPAEAIMQYKMAEAVYMSALQVGANIIQPTLLDFLQ